MKLELKAIKHSPSLSKRTEAFSANVYLNGKKAGRARNDGIGGYTFVHIDPEHQSVVNDCARQWLDILEPNPIDPSAPWPEHGEPFVRISAAQRKENTPMSYLTTCVDILLENHLTLKEIKKLKSSVTWTTTKCNAGEYVLIKTKPDQLSDSQKHTIEAQSDFREWLFDKEPQYIAEKLEFQDIGGGPLLSVVQIQ